MKTFSKTNKKMYLILESSSLRLPLSKTGNFKRYLGSDYCGVPNTCSNYLVVLLKEKGLVLGRDLKSMHG
jgi:hypothetical protein